MKPQSLSSFDIYIMAAELDNTLASLTIKGVIKKPDSVHFDLMDRMIEFRVIKGTPYIMWAEEYPGGKNWLEPVIGSSVVKINQYEMDRIVKIELLNFDRLGQKKSLCLYIELFKNGNIILADAAGRILSSFRRISNIGQKYEIQPTPGLNILNLSADDVLDRQSLDKIKSLNVFQYSDKIDFDAESMAGFIADTRLNPQPHIIYDEKGELAGFSVYGPPYKARISGEPRSLVLDAVTEYARSLAARKVMRVTDYKKQIKKAEKKLGLIKEELAGTEAHDRFRIYGELILANLSIIKKGQKECSLDNHYVEAGNGEKVVIPLEQSLSPEQNAGLYFDKSRKLKTAVPIIRKRLEKQLQELARLIKLESGELQPGGSSVKRAETKGTSQVKIPFRQYDLGDGWVIYAGKSAKSNDELTFGFAKKDDLWFHSWQAFGSHVILRAPAKGAEPGRDLLLKTASLAAYFSKAKTSGKVPVIYTEVRYVRKVKKVPGKVTYSNEKELMVEPLSPADLMRNK